MRRTSTEPSATICSCFFSSPDPAGTLDAAAAREHGVIAAPPIDRVCGSGRRTARAASERLLRPGGPGLLRGPGIAGSGGRQLVGFARVGCGLNRSLRTAAPSGLRGRRHRRLPAAPGPCPRRPPRSYPGSEPSTNSGVSERPQPRDRSPPKPESASRRNAAFTGSCQRSRAASSANDTMVHKPAPGAEFDAGRGVALARAGQPVHRGVPADAGAERTRPARRAPGTRSAPSTRPVIVVERLPGQNRLHDAQRNEARALPAHARGHQRRRGGRPDGARRNHETDVVQKRKAGAEAHRRRRALRAVASSHSSSEPSAPWREVTAEYSESLW